jgi:hypothetical protein
MPDTRVIDEPLIVNSPSGLDTFYVAHWAGVAFQDAQVKLGTIASFVGAVLASQEISETPTGSVDGGNLDFLLSQLPIGNSLALYKNGLLQKLGAGFDYTLNNRTISFVAGAAPWPGDVLLASYHT